jgi:DNA-binding response OmpR family regulator/anti-sigma regulatory factor (Ser/Thr protein kinase)
MPEIKQQRSEIKRDLKMIKEFMNCSIIHCLSSEIFMKSSLEHRKEDRCYRGTVLFFQKESLLCKKVKKCLQKDNFYVHIGQDERAIEELVGEICPDIVFLDLAREDECEFATLRALKKCVKGNYIPVVFISENEDENERLRIFEEGADDLISPPFSKADFLSRVDTLFQIRQLAELSESCRQITLELKKNVEVKERAERDESAIFDYLQKNLSILSRSRLKLVHKKEEIDILCQGEPLILHNIFERDDVRRIKELLAFHVKESFCKKDRWQDLVVSTSEAVANVMKYAGKGKITVTKNGCTFFVRIDDYGSGMDMRDLLRSIFIKTYSRPRVHRLGYPLMMQLADQLMLCSDCSGTTLVLQFLL